MSTNSEKSHSISRGLDPLDQTSRQRLIAAIIAFFQDERNEEIGVIAAEEVLDFFLAELGPEVHNQAIETAKREWHRLAEDGEIALEVLKKK